MNETGIFSGEYEGMFPLIFVTHTERPEKLHFQRSMMGIERA